MQPVAVQPVRRFFLAKVRPVARPSPVFGSRHQTRSHWIAFNIAEQSEQVSVAVHQDRLETALKHMPCQSVTAVEALGVDAVDMTHQSRQIGPMCVQHQVRVIAHHAISQQLSVESVHGLSEDGQVQGSIVIAAIDEFAPVSTRGDVTDGSG